MRDKQRGSGATGRHLMLPVKKAAILAEIARPLPDSDDDASSGAERGGAGTAGAGGSDGSGDEAAGARVGAVGTLTHAAAWAGKLVYAPNIRFVLAGRTSR